MRWHSEQIGGAGGRGREGWGKGEGNAGCEEPTVGQALFKVASHRFSRGVLPASPQIRHFHLKGRWGRLGGSHGDCRTPVSERGGSTLPGKEIEQTFPCKLPTVRPPP